MKKEAKGFFAGMLITSIILTCIPAFASNAVKTISFSFNSVKIALNGQQVPVDNLIYNGTTYVKLTQVCNLLGKTASYDKKTKIVNITDQPAVTNSAIVTVPKPDTASKPGKADNTPLKLEKAIGMSMTSVQLVFNKKLDKQTAENTANYIIKERYGAKNQLTVSSAELSKEDNKVLITCNNAKFATLYNLEVNAIKDESGNTVQPGNTSITVIFGKDISQEATPAPAPAPAPTPSPASGSTNVDSKFALEAALAPSNDSVQIYFSHKLDAATAGNSANYSIKSPDGTSLSISSCNCEPSGKTVMLKTAKLSAGVYTLTVSNINDIYGNKLDTATVVFAGNTASN